MRKTTSFVTEKSFEDIKLAAEDIARDLGGWNIKFVDEQNKIIKMSVTFNALSFGEDVEIAVQTNSAGTQNVTVISKPVVPTTLFDYGKNNHNLTIVTTYVTSSDPVARQAVQKNPNITTSIVVSVVIVLLVFMVLTFLVGMYMYSAL